MNSHYLAGALIALAPVALLAQATTPPVGNSMETGAPTATQQSNMALNGSDDAAMDTNSVDATPLPDAHGTVGGATTAGNSSNTDDAPPPKP